MQLTARFCMDAAAVRDCIESRWCPWGWIWVLHAGPGPGVGVQSIGEAIRNVFVVSWRWRRAAMEVPCSPWRYCYSGTPLMEGEKF